AGQGAKQPGMTGQVKEEILARMAELGAFVEGGALYFDPLLLREGELAAEGGAFTYIDAGSRERSIGLPPGSPVYTLCQTPVVYLRSGEGRIEVACAGGGLRRIDGLRLDPETSGRIFCRDGTVERLTVYLGPR